MSSETFIIAEGGVNHNGSIELALGMVDAAYEAGVDAIKFQIFKAERLVSQNAPKAEYQLQTTDRSESQFQMIKKLELSESAHKVVLDHCREKPIEFLSSPFDLAGARFLYELGVKIFKIPSGEITNLPLLATIGEFGKEVVLSTGMADLGEIEDALQILIEAGTGLDKITVLHCNTEYPTPFKDVNLRGMQRISKAFGVKVGYSDHTEGIEVPIAAVALGASVVEKHFTLDRNLPGPDHRVSIEPDELKRMVQSIRNIELAMGSGIKKPSQSEIKNRPVIRKSIVAAKKIRKGEFFTEENLAVKRPGTGISPMRWYEVLGKKAPRGFAPDELIEL